MRLAVMQPYIFPYIGYFQMIQAVDLFVFYDDVNFIKRGWINRNRILIQGAPHLITVPCKSVSLNKLINEIEVDYENKGVFKAIRSIDQAYKKAPHYSSVMPLVNKVFKNSGPRISDLAASSIKEVCAYLGLKKEFKVSSEEGYDRSLNRADRLIDICKKEGASEYVNAAGGMELYSKPYFQNLGVDLYFINPELRHYKQFKNEFVSGLSIIDVLMFNSVEHIREQLLTAYTLV